MTLPEGYTLSIESLAGSVFHMLLPSRIIALALPFFLALPLGDVKAQPSDPSCEAVEKTEAMRADGHYRQARARLLECVNAQCGGDVRRRCAATLQKLDATIPSIVVRAEDYLGNDLTDVAVSLGDEPLVSSLDGLAIPVDPGQHRFVFRRPGYEPVTQTVTILPGEKFRAIDVKIGAPPEPPPPVMPAGDGPGMSSARLAGGVSLIGVGVAGLAGFTWLGLKARSEEKELTDCRPCSSGRVDGVRKRYLLANVTLGLSIVSLGAGTWLLLSGSSSDDIARPADEGLAIGADSDGAFASYSGRF